jgi:outer membrane protein TolC
VVDAEGSLVAARTALVGLLTDYQVARFQLLKSTGTLDVAKEFLP